MLAIHHVPEILVLVRRADGHRHSVLLRAPPFVDLGVVVITKFPSH